MVFDPIHPPKRTLALFDYIEVFYNRTRHQAGLDHRTPDEHEKLAGAA